MTARGPAPDHRAPSTAPPAGHTRSRDRCGLPSACVSSRRLSAREVGGGDRHVARIALMLDHQALTIYAAPKDHYIDHSVRIRDVLVRPAVHDDHRGELARLDGAPVG